MPSPSSQTFIGDVISSGGFKKVKFSKYRHVYGTGARKDQCYEGIRISSSAHDAQLCALNPKFIAVALEVAGGGAFQVLPLEWTGRVDYHSGRVSGHNGPVTDLKWDPFNDNVIASSSDDCTVKLWFIEDGGVKTFVSDWLCELRGHTRKVAYVEWHPTVQDVIASASHDHMVLLWNVGTTECLASLNTHQDVIYSLSFSLMGNLIATTCKDKKLRIFEARSGECKQDVICHEGSKPSKCICVTKLGYIVTTGFSKTSSRQISLWNQEDLSSALTVLEVDYSSGVLFPFLDADLNMVYIAGKGDGNIRYYEVTKQNPFLHYLSEYRSAQPQRGFGVLPKRALKLNQCEVFRMYKLHAIQCLVSPISFVVPRKSEMFQSDLYPPTASPTPALTIQEWLMGMDKFPVTMSLQARMTVAPVTCKPVRIQKGLAADSSHTIADHKSVLITSDPNNDRKFQFLSQITRADYREVSKREDYPQLMQERQLRQRAASPDIARNGRRAVKSPIPSSPKISKECRSSTVLPLKTDGDSAVNETDSESQPAGSPRPASQQDNHKPAKPDCHNYKIALLKNSELSTSSEVGEFLGHHPESTARPYDSNPATPLSSDLSFGSTPFRLRVAPSAGNAGLAHVVSSAPETVLESPTSSISSNGKSTTGASIGSISNRETPVPSQTIHTPSQKVNHLPPVRTIFSNLATNSRHQHSASSNGVVTEASQLNLTRGYTFTFGFPSKQSSGTRPGRIGPAPLVTSGLPTQTAHVRPFQVKHKTAQPLVLQQSNYTAMSEASPDIPTSHSLGGIHAEQSYSTPGASGLPSELALVASRGADATSSVASWSESPSKRESELQKLYGAQCKQVRSLLEDRAAKEARIQLLEDATAKKTANCDRHAQNLERKLEEIECLRHEIAWKDARIEELQNQLYRVAALVPDYCLSKLKETE